MTSHENDISWSNLRGIVRDCFGGSADLAEVKPLLGGCINNTFCLTMTDGLRAVLKLSAHRVTHAFVDEEFQLRQMGDAGMPVPGVYRSVVGSLDYPYSFIMMEFVDGIDLHTAKHKCSAQEYEQLQIHLAGLLKELHSHTSDRYMRVGLGQREFDRWPDFFREIYGEIWHDVEKSSTLPIKCRKQIGRIHERLPQLLAHDDCPRLLHWDLWAMNVLVKPTPDGWRVAAMLDPNCKFGHAEAELAYMELFHTITPAFMAAYQCDGRLPSEYHRVRKLIYQLYQLLNHVRLFGNEYAKRTMDLVDRLHTVV